VNAGPGPLDVEIRDDRAVLTLTRPAVRNTIDQATVDALHDACALLEADPLPMLLTGSDGVFAAGADIRELRERRRDHALSAINRQVFDRIARLPMPTLAAVDGAALSGGAELAYACDMRIASTRATFGNPEPGLGIVAAAGAVYRLPDLVGRSAAKAVLLAGQVLDADSAFRLGLVMEVTAPAELIGRAHAIVDRIAAQSALALRITKLLTDSDGPHPVADDLAQAILFETEDKEMRMTSFLERRSR
jgi:enoyl-CoA hydratase